MIRRALIRIIALFTVFYAVIALVGGGDQISCGTILVIALVYLFEPD